MLNLTWGMVLDRKYFNQSAEGAGFARPVSLEAVTNVRETLKTLKGAASFGYPSLPPLADAIPPSHEDFVIAMKNWFIDPEDDADFQGWYTDINIQLLTTIVNRHQINGACRRMHNGESVLFFGVD